MMAKPGPEARLTDKELMEEVVLHPDPAVTVADIERQTDYSRQALNLRFDALVESGYLHEKKVGARATVYWPADEGREIAQR